VSEIWVDLGVSRPSVRAKFRQQDRVFEGVADHSTMRWSADSKMPGLQGKPGIPIVR